MKKISVALATYNGEKYIEQQLQSIYDQELPVDEVIISDDMSTDSTLTLVENFIEVHGLKEKWLIYVNGGGRTE